MDKWVIMQRIMDPGLGVRLDRQSKLYMLQKQQALIIALSQKTIKELHGAGIDRIYFLPRQAPAKERWAKMPDSST